MRLLTLLLPLIGLTAVAQAEVYKWTDAQGRTHFANRPPAGVQTEQLRLPRDTVSAGDKVYTWTDEQGTVHYGDHPPARVRAQLLDTDAMPLSTIRADEPRPSEKPLPGQ